MKSKLTKSVFSLISPLCLISSVVAGDQISIELMERQPSEELMKNVTTSFQSSNKITVRYIPIHTIGYSPMTKEDVLINWDYNFSFHCPISCGDRASVIQTYFESGLRQATECPGPYNAVFDLQKDDALVFRAYIDSSGRCFSIGEYSYFAKGNFNKFMPDGSLYPAFTKP